MKYVALTLTEPPSRRNDMHMFIVETPGYEETALLAWNEARSDCDVFLFRVVGPIDPYRSAIETPNFIRSFDLTPIDDDAFYAYVEQTSRDVDREFQTAFTDNRVLAVPPVVFDADGTTKCKVVGESDALQTVLEDVPDDIDVRVDELGEYDTPWGGVAATLTDRQLTTLRTAFDVGYYDVPRTGTVEEVADRLECAASTASRHLGKAEQALVRSFLK
ncbi:MAG: helix-turn-helix domain-containing protein [Halapricum sp.]